MYINNCYCAYTLLRVCLAVVVYSKNALCVYVFISLGVYVEIFACNYHRNSAASRFSKLL